MGKQGDEHQLKRCEHEAGLLEQKHEDANMNMSIISISSNDAKHEDAHQLK